MENETMERIFTQVCEEYKKEIPTGFECIDEQMLKIQLKKSYISKYSTDFQTVEGQTLYQRSKKQCAYIILIALFACINEKLSYEKSLERFIDNLFLDPKMYNVLMLTMPEFCELDASLSEKNRKRFARARNARKTTNAIAAFRTFGISAAIREASFTKRSKGIIGNPMVRDIVVMLNLTGVLGNDNTD